jgi:hypothetical protein
VYVRVRDGGLGHRVVTVLFVSGGVDRVISSRDVAQERVDRCGMAFDSADLGQVDEVAVSFELTELMW